MKGSEIRIADAQIESFSYTGGRLTVTVRTDGGAFDIGFVNVIGMKTISPEAQDLSHLAECSESSYLSETCKAAEELSGGFREYAFISAWTDEPLLTVVAIDVEVAGKLS